MKNKFTSLFFILFIIGTNLSANSKTIHIKNIIKDASQNNKQVMVFFHMNHCGYCYRMENKTFQDKKVKKLIGDSFIFVDINIDDNEKVLFNGISYSKKDFAHSLDVDFYPTVVFLDKNAEITYTARGYRKIMKFKKILKYIQTQSFEKVDFFDYHNEK